MEGFMKNYSLPSPDYSPNFRAELKPELGLRFNWTAMDYFKHVNAKVIYHITRKPTMLTPLALMIAYIRELTSLPPLEECHAPQPGQTHAERGTSRAVVAGKPEGRQEVECLLSQVYMIG